MSPRKTSQAVVAQRMVNFASAALRNETTDTSDLDKALMLEGTQDPAATAALAAEWGNRPADSARAIQYLGGPAKASDKLSDELFSSLDTAAQAFHRADNSLRTLAYAINRPGFKPTDLPARFSWDLKLVKGAPAAELHKAAMKDAIVTDRKRATVIAEAISSHGVRDLKTALMADGIKAGKEVVSFVGDIRAAAAGREAVTFATHAL